MTRELLERTALVVAIGGDHSITYPVVRAFSGPLHVIQLDAHTDYSPFVHGLRFTNGHAFRHINKMSNVLSLTKSAFEVFAIRKKPSGTQSPTVTALLRFLKFEGSLQRELPNSFLRERLVT